MIKILRFLILLIPTIALSQHSIKGTFIPAKEFKYAILYRLTPTTSIYVNNGQVKDDGTFTIKMDSTAVSGMYRIVYALPQDEFNFDFIYNKEDVELTFDIEKGLDFTTSKENKLLTAYNKSLTAAMQNINAQYTSKSTNTNAVLDSYKALNKMQTEFEKAANGTLALAFIKASKPYIPTVFEDAKTFTTNYKNNFFNAIDFGNKTLQNSNFLIETTLSYVYTFVNEKDKNTSYINNIDAVIKAIGNNYIIKEILLETLWLQFSVPQTETVANYITDAYLLDIAKVNNDTELIEELTAFKRVSSGEKAPNFDLQVVKEDKKSTKFLYELEDSKNYLILFWSSTCSHCLKHLPEIKTFTNSFKKEDLQVIAVGLEDSPYRWKDLTYDYPNFIHVYGEGKWDNTIGNDYNVKSTPSYFVLDNDKKIVAKPGEFNDLKAFFKLQEKTPTR